MAVKVGNSWVSEAAYTYAKSRVENQKSGDGSSVLKELQEKYPDTNFRIGTAPFQGTGYNNISIAPNILKEMEENPEKRMEYEALIYDITSHQKTLNGNDGLKAHGSIITEDGGLCGWGISQSKNRSQISLNKKNKGNWLQEMLDSLNKSKKKKKKGLQVAKKDKGNSIGQKKTANKSNSKTIGNSIDMKL